MKVKMSEEGILKEIRGKIPLIGKPCERAKKLGSEFIKFI